LAGSQVIGSLASRDGEEVARRQQFNAGGLTKSQLRAIRFQVNYAISYGRLKRSPTCEQCGRTTRTQGHHDDYAKPLDVRWLCSSCHVRLHAGLPVLPENTEALTARDMRRRADMAIAEGGGAV
jgi:ribosomal protein S27AE